MHRFRETNSPRPQQIGVPALADYEPTPADDQLLEMVLFRAVPRRCARRLAKVMVARFGSCADAITAPPRLLTEFEGMTSGAIAEFKFIEAAVLRVTKGAAEKRLRMGSWSEVIDYCRASMAFQKREIMRILFLDKKCGLIADEVRSVGTVDYVELYPREVIARALELSASGIVLVHNHPSGDPTPSGADIDQTLNIIEISERLGLVVHDHFIVGRQGAVSLKDMGYFTPSFRASRPRR